MGKDYRIDRSTQERLDLHLARRGIMDYLKYTCYDLGGFLGDIFFKDGGRTSIRKHAACNWHTQR